MAGVYFYPAVIKNVVNRSTVSVMFMEDNIVKKVRKETEVVKVSQLLPGHGLTIKHDLYSAYDVTARLKSYPSRRGEELEYRVEIAATDSEPQTNEDCRVVTHNEITLTGDLPALEPQTKVREDFTNTETATTRAISWLKLPTSTFTLRLKTLLKQYA